MINERYKIKSISKFFEFALLDFIIKAATAQRAHRDEFEQKCRLLSLFWNYYSYFFKFFNIHVWRAALFKIMKFLL